ncbi:hypothetical protein [Sinorhizobium meliloti]|uniref:hypothetical protein n=1 Tax=Rhizobium meliloti TaxID=382 RepID=UPI001295ADE3|nr:hypothetical protein [Sinorhizobium meliloti]MQX55719.1 hypothetical protein [Sinorhizobium meliloti]
MRVSTLKAGGAAPAAVLTIAVLAGQFHASAAAAEIAVSILPRRVAEMGLGVTAQLRGRRPQIYLHGLSRRFHA